jgi:hypothetical protein
MLERSQILIYDEYLDVNYPKRRISRNSNNNKEFNKELNLSNSVCLYFISGLLNLYTPMLPCPALRA